MALALRYERPNDGNGEVRDALDGFLHIARRAHVSRGFDLRDTRPNLRRLAEDIGSAHRISRRPVGKYDLAIRRRCLENPREPIFDDEDAVTLVAQSK